MDKIESFFFVNEEKRLFLFAMTFKLSIIREFGIKFNESLTFIDFTKVTILIIRTLQTLKASPLSNRKSERPAK